MLLKNYNLKKTYLFFLAVFILLFSSNQNIYAEDLDELNDRINQKKEELQRLDREIEEQRKILQQTSGQATTLQSKINALEANRRKIESEIKKTQTEIDKAELIIRKLNSEISDKQAKINLSKQGIALSIREQNKTERISALEKFLTFNSLSDFWTELENNTRIQKKLQDEIDVLLNITTELKEKETEKITEKKELSQFQRELSGQQESVQQTKAEQQVVLQQTKNKEAEYKKLLDEKIKQKQAFEQEVLEIESKIKLLIDPKSFPTGGSGILGWPVDNIIITQYFGGTQFAKANPGIYGRGYHPGVDFGVPIGTKIRSVEAGTVQALGNTDAYPGCNAWGRWLLIKHNNGLTSMYAHLSSVLVSVGQQVERGEVVALSGNTGVSTGPHLHLTIYASQGVQVGKYSSYRSGSGCSATDATGPFADLNAYLDPMRYLPKQ